MYCVIDDLKTIIPEKELINLSNDIPCHDINTDVVEICIKFADELINASLRNKYNLPLTFVPDIVRQLSADITAYRLYSRRPRTIPDHIKDNYNYALKILEALQKGEKVLDLPAEHKGENIQQMSGAYICNKRPEDRIFNDNVWSSFRC